MFACDAAALKPGRTAASKESRKHPLTTIANSDLDVFAFCLGGSVFGWTADKQTSFRVLDAYADAGGNFIDTADSYSQWAPSNTGGESESILGDWLTSRGTRDRLVIATKVGRKGGLTGLSPKVIRQAVEESLRRLRTDYIDLYYTHADDPGTPLEETLSTLDGLISAGKVRHIGASNISGPRLAESLAVSKQAGLAAYVAVQPPFNLMEREAFENGLAPVCEREGISCVPYFALAQGFLTGKYRQAAPPVESVRGAVAHAYGSTGRGRAVLRALDEIAAEHGTAPAAVALAWLRAQPHVTAPLASSTTPEQLAELIPGATLELTKTDVHCLDIASRTTTRKDPQTLYSGRNL
ncbi:aldo/keto reductase [Streptomyces peucetius]|uniref:Aldo/keto reductase n=1 Tax=Streptomyces peucetius TaxID=1950 RepID=A0ABY6I2B6_STRPE|nr:aldo/keto reductase [Streptomyces peucetius]UYQ60909.1 aldo/keto reductase [Streptomyces peucetius]